MPEQRMLEGTQIKLDRGRHGALSDKFWASRRALSLGI